jgi:two-component system, OmpR family, phosphate regulon sensor histidine kinase PhoR
MGFAQWFWRLFLVFGGLIVAHVLLVTLLVVRSGAASGGAFPYTAVWLSAGLVLLLGAIAVWFCVQRIVAPLSQLTRSVRAASVSDSGPHLVAGPHDEVGVLAGAFDRMQRDLARRLSEIEQNNQRLETVLSSMAEGVLAVGTDRTILLANEAGRQLLDFATPSPVGRSLLEVTRSRPVHEAAAQAFRTSQPVVTEFDAPGVSRRTLSLRATRLPGEPCPGVMLVLHDMTELRRLENLRRELVANVSHELKTPLSAIKGYAETLRLGAVNDADHNLHFVRRIEEQADRLHELILDILQIARVESGQESFELSAVPVADVLEQCADQFVETAAAKHIRLTVEAPPPDVAVVADDEGLRTILSNLIDNGLKYTPEGGAVALRALADTSIVLLEVQDTGIGIPEKEQARIFERFYRVDKARSRELGGTGLGLSIVKHLALAFGGSVSVESQPGQGSIFRVQLRRATPNRP